MVKKILRKIKNHFITGLVVILPLGLTAWIVGILFSLIGNRFLPIFKKIPEIRDLPIPAQMAISAVLTIIVIWFIGLWARNYFGKLIIRIFEKLVLNTPVVSKIYKTVRKITDTMFVNKQAFKKVALVEYPRKDIYTIVFVTNDMQSKGGDRLVSVFVPSTPNPTTGYCVVLPEEDVHILDININQAMEFIFSGGIIVPEALTFKKFRNEKDGKEE
jgi:uncharacterized membrane protein